MRAETFFCAQILMKLASLIAFSLLILTGCRSVPAKSPVVASHHPHDDKQNARRLLCSDIGEEECLRACPSSALTSKREHSECLLELRFGFDPEALELARSLSFDEDLLLGVHTRTSIEGFKGQQVDLFPALPVGEHRRHLAWLQESLSHFGSFVEGLSQRTTLPSSSRINFDPKPKGVIFFRTDGSLYPSAYTWEGFVSYNVEGPLHTSASEMERTLFHELFHINDARRGRPGAVKASSPTRTTVTSWSEIALADVFNAILAACPNHDHDCFSPYSPYETTVPDGTFYPFDVRTRDVREYAAELALRYFLDHTLVLNDEVLTEPRFKCMTPENKTAWDRLAAEFFGGIDLTPPCPPSEQAKLL